MSSKTLSLTLAIIKPDIARVPYIVSSIRHRILCSGFLVLRTSSYQMSPSLVANFYKEHEGKFFYNRLTTFMSSGMSHIHVLAHPSENAITKWRELMGPTKVLRTRYEAPESIRGQFGLTDTRNGVHGSDSIENARNEIVFFFPDFDFEALDQLAKKKDFMVLDSDRFVHQLSD